MRFRIVSPMLFSLPAVLLLAAPVARGLPTCALTDLSRPAEADDQVKEEIV